MPLHLLSELPPTTYTSRLPLSPTKIIKLVNDDIVMSRRSKAMFLKNLLFFLLCWKTTTNHLIVCVVCYIHTPPPRPCTILSKMSNTDGHPFLLSPVAIHHHCTALYCTVAPAYTCRMTLIQRATLVRLASISKSEPSNLTARRSSCRFGTQQGRSDSVQSHRRTTGVRTALSWCTT